MNAHEEVLAARRARDHKAEKVWLGALDRLLDLYKERGSDGDT